MVMAASKDRMVEDVIRRYVDMFPISEDVFFKLPIRHVKT